MRNRLLYYFLVFTFVIYALAVINALFLRPSLFQYDSFANLTSWDVPYANLKPFYTIDKYLYHADKYNFDIWFKLFFGNLVLFLPFGLIVPLLSIRMRSMWRFSVFLLLVLLLVELAQKLSMAGAFDVDDIMMNFMGGIVGFGMSYKMRKLIR
ncbi:VanZ family protein [Cohnella sp.]|uniref:VanZ family protein n=1 Tax=Cohnella sp. TaxID=1883426 RepID=UPI0035617C1B